MDQVPGTQPPNANPKNFCWEFKFPRFFLITWTLVLLYLTGAVHYPCSCFE